MKRTTWALITVLILALSLSSCNVQAGSTVQAPKPPQATAAPILATEQKPASSKQPADNKGTGTSKGSSNAIGQTLDLTVEGHALDIILGQPTDHSVVLSLLADTERDVILQYSTEGSVSTEDTIHLTSNKPYEYTIEGLVANTNYRYSILSKENDLVLEEGQFQTQRAAGSSYVFTIQADSHLDSNTSIDVYVQNLTNQISDTPDFMIDLGDTFMTDKYKPYQQALAQYQAQRFYLSMIGKTSPLFLVIGNHDGETAPRGKNETGINEWSVLQRTTYFPNPSMGTSPLHPTVAQNNATAHENYYAWEWGDALYVVLDPYTYTPAQKSGAEDGWNSTLGKEQYDWLNETLSTSTAKYKFIFIHQLVGGLGKDGRGGVEAAGLYEWGGNNPDGTYAFDQMRPGWGKPIHQLLVSYGVNAVFHGHDHLFVRQELDGITYQEVPQPGSAIVNQTSSAEEYGYKSGDLLGGPGYLRVLVSPDEVTVDYVRTAIPASQGNSKIQNGQVDFSYTISGK